MPKTTDTPSDSKHRTISCAAVLIGDLDYSSATSIDDRQSPSE
jgi:hypothetical protein